MCLTIAKMLYDNMVEWDFEEKISDLQGRNKLYRLMLRGVNTGVSQ